MMLSSDVYVPALRWRMGEYQALFRLDERIKNRIVPYITIPEIEFDFESWQPKKTIHKHVEPFAIRYKSKWGERLAWLGVHPKIVQEPMDDGRDIFTYVFEQLRALKAKVVPVIPLNADADTIQSVAAIVKRDGRGVALSVRLEDLMHPNAFRQVRVVVSALGVDISHTDLIIDLGAPNFEPYEVFSDILLSSLCKIGPLLSYRNLVQVGTAIPKTFASIAIGADEVPRHDWLFYQTLIARQCSGTRRPNFGDYTITHPEFTAFDMRHIKPAGKIVYTTSDCWAVRKGGAFWRHREQMHDHCADIVSKSIFKGAEYSYGDDCIAKCAALKIGPGNLTLWKGVGINHHITHVSDELATLVGVP